MKLRFTYQKILLIAAGLFISAVLFAWLALPHFLQTGAQKYVLEKSGHHLQMDEPHINPFKMSAQLAHVNLTEPDGKPLLSLQDLELNISLSSLLHRSLVFDEIRLEHPELTLTLRHDGRINWSNFIAAFDTPASSPQASSSDFQTTIEQFALHDGKINFSDEKAGFKTQIEPLQIELDTLSTARDSSGSYQLQAKLLNGAQLDWRGQVTLTPLATHGTVKLEHLDLAQLHPYLKTLLPSDTPDGVVDFSTRYDLAQITTHPLLKLEQLALVVKDLRVKPAVNLPEVRSSLLQASNGLFDGKTNRVTLDELHLNDVQIKLPSPAQPVHLGKLSLAKLQLDLTQHRVELGRVLAKELDVNAVRNARGQLDILLAAQTINPPSNKPVSQPAAPAWHYRVGKIELEKCSAALRDETMNPPLTWAVNQLTATAENLSDDGNASLPVSGVLDVVSGGHLAFIGALQMATPSVNLNLSLNDFSLKAAQPYLSAYTRLLLDNGQLAAQGQLNYDSRGTHYHGGVSLNNLRLMESSTRDALLGWATVNTRDLDFVPGKLSIGTLNLDGLDSNFVVNKDKSVNIVRALKKSDVVAPVSSVAATSTVPPSNTFSTSIDRLHISNSAMSYADNSLLFPFATHIRNLHGALTGLSPNTIGQVALDGQVDEYGAAHAAGQINLFNPTDFTDIKVLFSNMDMNRLTPYSGTFAGRKIDSGKLTLDLEYKINKRQLSGENKLTMDNLELGDKVDSPQAKDMPLDLAIAILQDSDGLIDLGLPVSGSLDDPQFSYSSIIWDAIGNVMGKIITSPFHLLGNLFSSGEKFKSIDFAAGANQLTPPEQEKIVRLVAAMNKRPSLALTLHGVYADADKVALQDEQLRRAVVKKMGQTLDDNEDPGPISTDNPKVQIALENLYSERAGRGELAALKDGFRTANPGELPPSAGEKVASVLGAKHELSSVEIKQLEGADFHDVLLQRLRDKENIDELKLQALAKTRGEYLLNAFQNASAPAGRVSVGEVVKVAAENNAVAVKIDFGTAAKSASTLPPSAPASPAH